MVALLITPLISTLEPPSRLYTDSFLPGKSSEKAACLRDLCRSGALDHRRRGTSLEGFGLGGSGRGTIVLTHNRGLTTPLITTHEPLSRV